jgi:hypothetical protein
VHRDSTELFADYLALSSVNARANVNAQLLDRFHDCPSAADGTRWTIKRGEETITSSVDFPTSMPCELVTN